MATWLDYLFGAPDEDDAAKAAMRKSIGAAETVPDLVLGEINPEMARTIDPAQVQGYEASLIDMPEDVRAMGYDPALAGNSAAEDIAVDPRLRQAQLDALAQLQDVGKQGGLTAQDKARIAQIESDTATADRGRRDAILQNMRSRGMGGSSQELLAQLQSAQAATDQANQSGLNVAGMAQQRALDAMAGAGQLGGQIRGQDFGEQSAVAQSRDAMSRFNTANTNQARQFFAGASNHINQGNAGRSLGAKQFNAGQVTDAARFGAGARNAASMDYTNRAQGVEGMNTGAKNAAQFQNKVGTPTAQWNAKANQAKMLADAYGNEGNMWNVQGDRKAKTKAGLWDAGIKGAGAIATMMSDGDKKKQKQPITVDDLQEFFAAVKPKTFKYKDPGEQGALPGERVGFIAQDVKDTKLGQDLVSERDDGVLQYDPENLQGILLAALKEIGFKGDKK